MRLRSFLVIGAVILGVLVALFGFLQWVRSSFSWRTYIVQSGSMEPSIMTGDLIVLQKQSEYRQNQVITFKNERGRTVTHRIVSVDPGKNTIFRTKGDANQDQDLEEVREEQVIGSVMQVVPKFGYVVKFLKSPWGFILCILAPGIVILYDEIRALSGRFAGHNTR